MRFAGRRVFLIQIAAMRLITFLLAISSVVLAHAQDDSLNAPYRRNPGIPPFDLLKVDSSTHLTKADINVHKKTIIMFFSPECSHCQHQTEDMIAAIDSLKDIQIVMATYQPFEEMVEFNKKYGLEKYKNIKLGRDSKYFMPPFYRMRSLPHLALYDKDKYITGFEGNQKISTILQAFEPRG